MPFIALYDTNALFPNSQRDLLIRIGMAGLVQAKWTQRIVDDLGRVLADRRGIPANRIDRLKDLVNDSIPDCLITGYEPLIEGLKLPDKDDRHVLAAAIKSGSQVIVTANLADFPADVLGTWSIEAKAPDDFVLDQISEVVPSSVELRWRPRWSSGCADSLILACGADIPGEARVERGAELGQVQVAVDAAELPSRFGHAGGAPAQRHGPVPPPLDVLAVLAADPDHRLDAYLEPAR